jgi:serine/threonine protein kinase
MTDLGDVYAMARDFEKAKELYEEARKIYARRRDNDRIKEAQAKLSLGEQAGRYRLVKFLGLGGFANVYLGEYTDSKGSVKGCAAVKLLQDTEPETADTFSHEAGILLSLRHPHIVRGLEFGNTEDDVPYLVMEYVSDGTLRDAHQEGERVPLGQVVDYVVQIASALQYMHSRKLMHLDVKPENVLLVIGQDGKITLLLSDFGLARIAHSTASQSSIEQKGTRPYMDPEFLLGGRASNKSDQHALAVMVCKWLSGMGNRELSDMIYKLGSDKCPPGWYPSELGDVPEKIRRVILRGMARKPKDRFPSVGAFAGAFVEACAEHGVPIEEHLLPLMDELRKHVGMEVAQERVEVLDDKMRELQQENDDLKRKLESQDNRILREKINELNGRIQNIEEEKKKLEIMIRENIKFYDDKMQENQELEGRNQALQRKKQNLVDQRNRGLQKRQNQENQLQERVQLFEQQSFQQGDHGASTSANTFTQNPKEVNAPQDERLARGEASSSSTGGEGIDHDAEQERLDYVGQQTDVRSGIRAYEAMASDTSKEQQELYDKARKTLNKKEVRRELEWGKNRLVNGLCKEAVNSYSRVIELLGGDPSVALSAESLSKAPIEMIRAYAYRGEAHWRMKDYQKALNDLKPLRDEASWIKDAIDELQPLVKNQEQEQVTPTNQALREEGSRSSLTGGRGLEIGSSSTTPDRVTLQDEYKALHQISPPTHFFDDLPMPPGRRKRWWWRG